MNEIVLSLCDYSGNILKPWAKNGYECIAVDIENGDTTVEHGDGCIHYVQADVSDYLPPREEYAHGLGIGGGIELVDRLSGTGLLDSIDCSTPEIAAMNGCMLDERLRQKEIMVFPGGKGRNKRTYPLAEFNSWQIRDVWLREKSDEGQYRLSQMGSMGLES